MVSTPVEESEEEKKKKETAIRLRDEYFASLHQEESNVKERLDLIKYIYSIFKIGLK